MEEGRSSSRENQKTEQQRREGKYGLPLKNVETLQLSPSRGQRVRILLDLFRTDNCNLAEMTIKPRKQLKEVQTREASYQSKEAKNLKPLQTDDLGCFQL